MDNLKTLLTRGVEQVLPSRETLSDRLSQGPIKLFMGIDATGPSLHLGHLSSLMKLRDFQEMGHEVTVLLGDFTTQIGDPTDKLAARQVLPKEVIESNLKDYKRQVLLILDQDKTTFRRNSEWFDKMSVQEFLTLATEFTDKDLTDRDMFVERKKQGKPVYANELLYPLIQGYDSVALGVDLEVGGNDQMFNMLSGRDLLSRRGKEKFVLTTKLLVDPSGKKMGKTEGNMASLTDSPANILGKIMSWPDTLMPLGFEILTRIPEEEYQNILAGHPKEAKLTLAAEVVKLIYGEGEAKRAREGFGLTPENMEMVEVPEGTKLIEVLIDAGLVESKSEFRRLVEQGGISLNDNKITDPDASVAEGRVRVGPLRFLNIKLK
ncbi:MAG: tyrosine--tRNA ligase [Candidatus Pacebacteria bacterium]|nr:tyrosine--tRNA ligase [Candidatus Paceibacterota bacterium]